MTVKEAYYHYQAGLISLQEMQAKLDMANLGSDTTYYTMMGPVLLCNGQVIATW